MKRMAKLIACLVCGWSLFWNVQAADEASPPAVSREVKTELDALFQRFPEYYRLRVMLEAAMAEARKNDAPDAIRDAGNDLDAFHLEWTEYESDLYDEMLMRDDLARAYAAEKFAAQAAPVAEMIAAAKQPLPDVTVYGPLYMASDLGYPDKVIDEMAKAADALEQSDVDDLYALVRLRCCLAMANDDAARRWLSDMLNEAALDGENAVNAVYILALIGDGTAIRETATRMLEAEKAGGYGMLEWSLPLAYSVWLVGDSAPLKEIVAAVKNRFAFYPPEDFAVEDDPTTPENEAVFFSPKYLACWDIGYTMKMLDLARQDKMPASPYLLDEWIPVEAVDRDAAAAYEREQTATEQAFAEYVKWAESIK